MISNLPNLISLLRLLLAPIMLHIDHKYLPLFFFSLALTDALDGFLARRWHVETKVGKVLDPLADKVFLLTAFYLCSFELKRLNPFVFLSLLARDFFIVFGALLLWLRFKSVPSPSPIGKMTTLALSLSGFLCILYESNTFNLFLSGVCLLFVFLSWIDYGFRGIKALKNQTSF